MGGWELSAPDWGATDLDAGGDGAGGGEERNRAEGHHRGGPGGSLGGRLEGAGWSSWDRELVAWLRQARRNLLPFPWTTRPFTSKGTFR